MKANIVNYLIGTEVYDNVTQQKGFLIGLSKFSRNDDEVIIEVQFGHPFIAKIKDIVPYNIRKDKEEYLKKLIPLFDFLNNKIKDELIESCMTELEFAKTIKSEIIEERNKDADFNRHF